MKLKIINASLLKKRPTASVQMTGKMSLNNEGGKFIEARAKRRYLFASDEEKKDVYYLIPSENDKNAMTATLSAGYFAFNYPSFFKDNGMKEGDKFIITKTVNETYPVIYVLQKQFTT